MDIGEKCKDCGHTKSLVEDFDIPDVGLVCMRCYNKPIWIDAKKESPRKDIPILIVSEFSEIPNIVRWLQDGTYGYPAFFESNDEYEIKEENILYWMPAPKIPTINQTVNQFPE
jgi:23S rRNA G2069 N7-methylase RlmK/C1962 C5-methylase RlmI